jgi:hypothetical protein
LKVVGGARCQRPRKPLACSGRGDTAPRAGREEKDARGLDNSGNIEGFFKEYKTVLLNMVLDKFLLIMEMMEKYTGSFSLFCWMRRSYK